ncbi:MAG: hypothetical protein ABEJ79_01185 [Halolamina sp.]
MRSRPLTDDDRAVTTTLSYVLTLVITATLVSGLLIAAGGAVQDRREDVARDELRVVGQQLGARLLSADRLARTGAGDVRVTASMPRSVAGSRYRIEFADGSPVTLTLRGVESDVRVSVTVPVQTTVVERSVQGGDIAVVLTDAGELEVRRR